MALEGHLYDASSGEWSRIPSPPGDPIIGPQSAFADGRFLLLGTQCALGAVRFVGEEEPTCDAGAGVATWFDVQSGEWSSVEVPSWVAGPIKPLLSPASTMKSLGTSGSTLYLANERIVVAFDTASGHWKKLYDGSPGLIESCLMPRQIVVATSTGHGVETRTIEVGTGHVRTIETPFAATDYAHVGCGAEQAHAYISSGAFELRAKRWIRADGWPRTLQATITGTVAGVELAWAHNNSTAGPDYQALAFRHGTWARLEDQVTLDQNPYAVVDVGDGLVLQGGGGDRLHHQPVH